MQPVTTIRHWQFEQMQRSIKIVGHLLSISPSGDVITYRDGGTGWTVRDVICHLRDFEQIFLDRACLTVDQDFPGLPFPNPDELAAERQYSTQDVRAAYEAWTANREAQLAYLAERSDEDWQRTANHPRRGSMSLQDQLTVTVWHDNNHIEQMVHILAEKK
jgi:uncharacterized damage-inducible protein DinB